MSWWKLIKKRHTLLTLKILTLISGAREGLPNHAVQRPLLPTHQTLSQTHAQGGAEQRPGVRHPRPVRDPQVADPAPQEAGGGQLRWGVEGQLAEQGRCGREDSQTWDNVSWSFPTGEDLLHLCIVSTNNGFNYQEAEIMKKFSHPHLVAMYAVCTEQEPFYIITE